MVKVKNEDEIFSEVSVTNLIDVLLVILIVLMISGSAVVHPGISLKLPGVRSGEKTAPAHVEVTIAKNGAVYVGQQPSNLLELKTRMISLAREKKGSRVLVRADGSASYGQIMAVLNVIRSAGIESVSLAVENRSF